VAGEVALEDARCFAGCFAFCDASRDVVAGRWVVLATVQDDGVQGAIELAVAAAAESMADRLTVDDSAGTLTLTVSGSTFNSSQTHDGFHAATGGNASVTISASGSTFTNPRVIDREREATRQDVDEKPGSV
jgi:hypothetical protein